MCGFVFFVFYATTVFDTSASVQINEVMASNGVTVADEDGDFEDWIELRNIGGGAIDLGGWGLSDREDAPFRWVFPAPTVVVPGAYLLVWASGKDRSGAALHTNFSISASGEWVGLTRPNGSRADELPPTALLRDISVGRVEGEGSAWFFFDEPTPASANTTAAFLGVLDPPEFSCAAGFYEAGFELTLSVPPGVSVLYTLDGSEPNPAGAGERSYVYKNAYPRPVGSDALGPLLPGTMRTEHYKDPLPIIQRSGEPERLALINTHFTVEPLTPRAEIFKATIVRARAVQPGYLPSRVATRTYFVDPAMTTRFGDDFAVISISADEADFFDYERGIYVPGKIADEWRLDHPNTGWNPGQPANYHGRGTEWERPAHLEVFSSAGDAWLSQDIGLRIHGGWSRGNRVKSLRLYARSRYGEDVFAYPLFGARERRGLPGEPLDTFRRLILRNSGGFNDWEFTYFRDAFVQSLIEHLPLDGQAYRPAVHFLNGEYWGLINMRERLDGPYLASHYAIEETDIAILTTPLQQPLAVDTGTVDDLSHFLETVAYAESHDFSDPLHYAWIQERVDTTNLALFYAVQIYFNNKDWPDNNNDLWRKRTEGPVEGAPPGHDGRWRWLLYDTDFGFGGWNFPRTGRPLARVVQLEAGSYRVNTVASNSVNRLFRALVLKSPEFRHTFINTLADQLNSSFVTERVLDRIAVFEALIGPARAEHNDRWDSDLRSDPKMVAHALNAPATSRVEVLEVFALSGVHTVGVDVSEGAGRVRLNTLTIDGGLPGLPDPAQPYPWTGLYFDGVPVLLEALPDAGHRFVGWRLKESEGGTPGDPSVDFFSTEPILVWSPDEPLFLEAVFEPFLVDQPPEVQYPMVPEGIALAQPGATLALNVSDWFIDPDGDALAFTADSADSAVFTVVAEGDLVLISAYGPGSATLTVWADDGRHAPVPVSLPVLVYPEPFRLSEGVFGLDHWEADAPAGTFPAHMVFLQGEENDSGLNTPLRHAYHIPPEDAAQPADVAFPYAAASRTRINGLGEDGIAFINTGRGRDLGAALLALDTRGAENIQVTWTAQTLIPNSRIYALRLQYRLGHDEAWETVFVDGEPVEYVRSESADEPQLMGPVGLPAELENHPLVHLQWRYYRVSGTSGPRARLRLDDVLVQATVKSPEPTIPFSTWIAEPKRGVPVDQQGLLDEPARDGLSNLLKFALGLEPMVPHAHSRPSPVVVNDEGSAHLALRYRQRQGGVGTPGIDYTVDGLTYRVEVAQSLEAGAWTGGPEFLEWGAPLIDNADGTETVTIRLREPLLPGSPRFLRLSVGLEE